MDDFIKKILNERYDFFIKRDYVYFYDRYNIYISTKDKEKELLDTIRSANATLYKVTNKESCLERYNEYNYKDNFIESINANTTIEDFKDLNKQFFIEVLKKYSLKESDVLFKQFYKMFNFNFNENYQNVINSVFTEENQKDILKFFRKLNTTNFSIDKVDIKEFRNFLIKKTDRLKNNIEDVDSLLISLIKRDKAKVNSPSNVADFRSNLLKAYDNNEEKLKAYLPLIPSLEKVFGKKEVKIEDVFQETHKNYATLLFNYTQLNKSFFVDDLSDEGLLNASLTLLSQIAKFYNLEHYNAYKTSKNWRIIRAEYNYSNDNFKQSDLEKVFIDFFNYLSENPKTQVDDQSVFIWLRQNKLKEELKDIKVTQRSVNKNKI